MDQSSNYSTSSEDDTHAMARHNATRGRLPKRVELDLSAVMNVEQKFQLQRLVNAIMDDIQKQLRDNFDQLSPSQIAPELGINPPKPTCNIIPNPRSEKYRHLYIEGVPPPTTATDSRKENVKPAQQPDIITKAPGVTWKAPKSPHELRAMYQKTEAEVLTASLAELKRDNLANFSKWRLGVQKRLQDIVIKNGGTSGNVGGQGLPQASGSGTCAGDSNIALVSLNPPTPTPLKECPKEKRALILHTMLLILLGLDQYAMYSRVLMVKLTSSLCIPMYVLLHDEVRISRALSKIITGIPVEEIVQRRTEEAKTSRRWRPGMAAVAQGGNASTLAAPLVVAGLGTVFGGAGLDPSATAVLLGPMNESTVVVGTLFGLYGARQGSKTIDAHSKDVQDFGMVLLHNTSKNEVIDPKDVLPEDRRMRVTIGISGLLNDRNDFPDSWKILGNQNESYAMRWDLEALTKMGVALESAMKSVAWHEAKKEIGSRTVFDSLRQSLWPSSLVKISKVVENPWCVGMVRAEKAGGVLAECLMNRIFGERPVTLIGYSLGARVIYACLMALSEKRGFGLVENVILMGAPCPSEVRVWAAMKSVVAGRLVNAYSKFDYMLGFLYRSSNWQDGVAGLQRVEGVPNVENCDVGDVIINHLRYCNLAGSILRRVGWEDIDYSKVGGEQWKLNVQMNTEKELQEEREQIEKVADNDIPKTKTKVSRELQEATNKMRRATLGNK
ncbi:DUF726-domain-containing protein [Hypoxylon trugodes]|uniref:DUF726-domain-containing protein n=1 Tax=Hypoxylon trugodes TaxID=326681 RepID=UPI0021902517|nr:DUF726-domain-containing protein [Hypoxylon trugodes]KAI1388859.1 DUF726-domain-containing protein [Hypoxylon trugodes]